MQEKFLKSVTARLTVAQVVANVQAGAELTFDFLCYVICASWLAACGLLDSDVVTLVASMLVSPLMVGIIGHNQTPHSDISCTGGNHGHDFRLYSSRQGSSQPGNSKRLNRVYFGDSFR